MIKVLVIDDSPVARALLAETISSDPEMEVVGLVTDGSKALAAVQEKRPDVVTMDIHMPLTDGFEATRSIMRNAPTPIVMVSSSIGDPGLTQTFSALEAGALTAVRLPPGPGHPEHQAAVRELIQTVRTMSEVKVVRRIEHTLSAATHSSPLSKSGRGIELVAIGASTGGPAVLKEILSGLPRDLAAPLLIVQHITPGFVGGLVEWLGSTSGFPLEIAESGQRPLDGHGYVAPDGFHMGLHSHRRIELSPHEPENGLRPSVAYLFRSVAEVLGRRAAGVLLTGMGKDGAKELREMKDKGALTVAQDEASSSINGMPGEAVRLGAAMHVLPPARIIDLLVESVGKDR